VKVQKVRWDRGGTKPAGEYTFSMEKGTRIMNEKLIFVHDGNISAINRVKIVSYRMWSLV
jgi:hypothetical protein